MPTYRKMLLVPMVFVVLVIAGFEYYYFKSTPFINRRSDGVIADVGKSVHTTITLHRSVLKRRKNVTIIRRIHTTPKRRCLKLKRHFCRNNLSTVSGAERNENGALACRLRVNTNAVTFLCRLHQASEVSKQ
jgi:hypothetical protein